MTALKMPMTLPTLHIDLINLFQDVYNQMNDAREPGSAYTSRADVAAVMAPKTNMAVMLAALNYQVENGGFKQWHGNDYWREGLVIVPFLEAAKALGVEGADQLHQIVSSALNEIQEYENSASTSYSYDSYDDEGEDIVRSVCDEQDTALYAMDNRLELYQTLLDRFDEINNYRTNQFFIEGFRKAA